MAPNLLNPPKANRIKREGIDCIAPKAYILRGLSKQCKLYVSFNYDCPLRIRNPKILLRHTNPTNKSWTTRPPFPP